MVSIIATIRFFMWFFVFKHFSLENLYQILLILLAFLMPLTVFGANLIIVIICLLWLLSGNYKTKYYEIINSRLLIASIIFFLIHVLGLIWTEDRDWGFHIVHKMWYFLLLLPVLSSLVRKDNINFYITAFLSAIFFTEVVSYMVWFELIPEFRHAQVINPTPFMSHVSYNPILAFAIYLVLHKIFFSEDLSKVGFSLNVFFALTMSFNMFITGGRAGQVMFFTMVTILIFQLFNRRIKSLFIVLILLPSLFMTAYQFSPLFNQRVNSAVEEVINYDQGLDYPGSVGKRITLSINSLDIVKENPIFGVGTGDFPSEYKKMNITNNSTTELNNATNPHNMYLLIFVQLGLIGLLSMLSISYYQIKLSFHSHNRYLKDIGITLPLLFLVIMLSDSYLLGHFTTLVYIFFSSFLYKDFEKN